MDVRVEISTFQIDGTYRSRINIVGPNGNGGVDTENLDAPVGTSFPIAEAAKEFARSQATARVHERYGQEAHIDFTYRGQ